MKKGISDPLAEDQQQLNQWLKSKLYSDETHMIDPNHKHQ